MARRSIAERNLAAEVRAVEEGHHAFLVERDGRSPYVRVVSDVEPGRTYRVTAAAGLGGVWFGCTPSGPALDRCHGQIVSDHPGVTPCKHAALAARRLERAGILRFDGRLWISTNPPELDDGSDPFAGLPT